MKLSVAIIAGSTALASARSTTKNVPEDLSNVEIDAESKTGNRILSKARRLDGDDEFTWIAGYGLKFQSCVSFQDYYGGQFSDNGNGAQGGQYNGQYANNAYGANDGNRRAQNNQYQYYNYGGEDRNDYQGMYQQQLVHFKLCPSSSRCYSCKNGAEYVVTLNDFVEAILEAKMTAQEYKCERVRENCYCDNANNGRQACQYNCFKNAGMEECAEAMYEQEFELQDAVECKQIEVDEEAARSYYYNNRDAIIAQYGNRDNYDGQYGQNNGQYGQNGQNGQGGGQEIGEIGDLYVGPYCSKNGKSIHLGVFMEETCSLAAPAGIYEALHYGDSLPYSKKSMVDHSCLSCKEPKEIDYDKYWDQQQEPDEASEVCANIYEIAGKCEENLDGYYPYRDVTGCTYIHSLKASGIDYPKAGVPAKVFAGIFAVTTVILAGVAAVLLKKNRRQNVSLTGDAIIS